MADNSSARAFHGTLTGTDADTVTLGWRPYIEIVNRSGDGPISVKIGAGDPPDALGDDTEIVMPGGYLVVAASQQGDTVEVQLVGDGNAYSVTGRDGDA